jgi:hypothetical protein
MAPEMWRGEVSIHSDQYSLAVAWHEMRTGRSIFPGKNQLAAIAQQHLSETPDLSSLPESEQQVLFRALDKEPGERFPNCVAFALALKEAAAPPKPPTATLSPTSTIKTIPVQSWGTRAAIVSLAFGLTAVLIALYVVLGQNQTASRPPGDDPTKVVVSWQPRGWEAEDPSKLVEDRNGRRYYRCLVRQIGSQKVTLVAIPQTAPTDPPTFYVMENKVHNDFFAVFMADPKSNQLLTRYSSYPGCDRLVRGEWRKGGYAPTVHPDPNKEPYFGVEGTEKGRLPVFRATVTEAHCFAEWLGGRLPTQEEWWKAAGRGEDSRLAPFDGNTQDKKDLAIGLSGGPWPVDRGNRDVSIHGCRQMASNGKEWTRDLSDKQSGEGQAIPLNKMNLPRQVCVQGQSYLATETLTFKAMDLPDVVLCTEAPFDVTFRVVLEQ